MKVSFSKSHERFPRVAWGLSTCIMQYMYSIANCKKTEGNEVRCFYFVKTAFGSCLIESKGRSLKHRSGKIQQGTEVVLKPPPHHVTTGVRDLGEDVYNTQKTPATNSFYLQIFTTSQNKGCTQRRSVNKWNVKVSHPLNATCTHVTVKKKHTITSYIFGVKNTYSVQFWPLLTSQFVHQFSRTHVRKGNFEGKDTHSTITLSEIITCK